MHQPHTWAALAWVGLGLLVACGGDGGPGPNTGITVTAVSPANGPLAGGTSVTITGTNFANVTSVTIGGSELGSRTVVSTAQITGTTPAASSSGAKDLVVTSSSQGSGTCGGCFSYLPPGPVASVEVTPTAAGVVIGQTVQLTATVKDAAGNALTDRQLTWTSNAPEVASVSASGLVTGLALGDSVVITATSEGKSGGASITVVINLAGEWNFTEQLKVIVRQSANLLAQVGTCSDTGSFRFIQNGADIGGTKAHVGTCHVRPAPYLPYVSSRDNTAWAFPIEDGQLTSAHIRFGIPNGCHYEGDVVGQPTPKLTGTYWCPNVVINLALGTWEATPGGAPVGEVAVRWDARTVAGGAVQLLAVPRDAAGHVLSRAVTWNPSGAVVSDRGLVTGLATGSANIAASSEGLSGSATVTADPVSFTSVSAGDGYHSCAVTSTGAAYCWGWGGNGELGVGFRPIGAPPRVAPLATAETPLAVAGAHTFAMVSPGGSHSCGVTPTGAGHCWGDNSSGQLGDGSTTSSLVPVPVTGGHQFASVTVGYWHSCGVTTANEVYCWGDNYTGQLGGGGSAYGSASSPQLVTGGFLFRNVRAGFFNTCGVTTTYAAYCWGWNQNGQVGNGTTAFAVTSPTGVAGGHSFVTVAPGARHSCGIAPDGTAYCWGNGQLTPVQVAGGPFATADGALAAGTLHTCAVTPTREAYCWGSNIVGQLGDGSTIARSTPVPVSGGLSFATISTGGYHTCGVTTAGVAFCWGDNANGQLGADAPASCVVDANGTTLPCATAPVRVIGQPGAVAAGSLRVEGRMQRPAAEPSRLQGSLGPALLVPAPSIHPPR